MLVRSDLKLKSLTTPITGPGLKPAPIAMRLPSGSVQPIARTNASLTM